MMKIILTIFLIILLFTPEAVGQTLWQRGWTFDGDTVNLRNSTQWVKTRLAFIDAPEWSQGLGTESREYLQMLLNKSPQALTVFTRGTDRYGRFLAEIANSEGQLINLEMVRAGMAYFYRPYCKIGCDYGLYNQAEQEAKTAKRGVWNPTNTEPPPWEWRTGKQ